MILTFKVRHGGDFSDEIARARMVAEYAIEHHTFSSKDVKHLGLPANIANQILRKYGRNKTIKKVRHVNLIIPGKCTKVDRVAGKITLMARLGHTLLYPTYFRSDFEKINQVELDEEFAYISVTVKPESMNQRPKSWLGVDMNTTGHCAVAANPDTGKVLKMGKKANHIHQKYKQMRRTLQKKGKYGLVKKIKNRESRIVRDTNRKIAHEIVTVAKSENAGVKVEALAGIRSRVKTARSFRYSLNSWSFFQLRTMLEYKAELLGVQLVSVDPAYTSQDCSRCGTRGNRDGKVFRCPNCGHLEHADVNAAFNVATRPPLDGEGIVRLHADRDACKGSIDTPGGAPP